MEINYCPFCANELDTVIDYELHTWLTYCPDPKCEFNDAYRFEREMI